MAYGTTSKLWGNSLSLQCKDRGTKAWKCSFHIQLGIKCAQNTCWIMSTLPRDGSGLKRNWLQSAACTNIVRGGWNLGPATGPVEGFWGKD